MIGNARPPQQSTRLKALDGIRAFAVLAVFAHHAYDWIFPGAFIGVDVFFVLSGFVITRSLLHEGINFRRFYLHRFFRIVPPVIPVLMFAAVTLAAGCSFATWQDIVAAFASYMNWIRVSEISDGGFIGHFWSLSVEEQFYLLWPIALYLLARWAVRLQTAAGILVAGLVIWQIGLFITTGDVQRVYGGLDTRGSQLAMGCLLATMRPHDLGRLWIVPTSYFVATALFVEFDSAYYLTVGIPLAGIMAMVLIGSVAWSRTPLHWILESRLAQWGGSRSYALYLWHYPLLMTLFAIGADIQVPAFITVGAAIILTCVAAELSFRLVERPARMLRDRIEGSNSG